MANSNGSPQPGIGAIEPEAPQVRIGSGMGGHISCTEGLLWISRHPDRIGRGALARDIELCQATQVQPSHRGRSPGDKPIDGQLVVSEHGGEDHKFHRQV